MDGATTQFILAAAFLAAAIPKLTNQHSSIQMFATIGAGHWLQFFVGAAELTGAVGLLIVRERTLLGDVPAERHGRHPTPRRRTLENRRAYVRRVAGRVAVCAAVHSVTQWVLTGSHASMMNSMTTRKIAITLPEEQVLEAKRAVTEGRARSVSAYIAEAVAARAKRHGLRAYVDALIAEHGKPTSDDYAWADAQLDSGKRRRAG